MASSDALQLLRASIAVSKTPVLTTSSDPTTAEANQTDSFVEATSLFFSHPTPLCLPLDQKTRFTSTNPDTVQVDLRSIFFAWLQKDVAVPEYIALAAELDKQLPEGQKVRNLIFVERLDLITWLEGASEESEYIKPIEGAAALGDAADRAVDITSGAAVPTVGGAGVGVTQTVGGRPVKTIDARLQAIYNGERRLGDHNAALRGIKPTVRNSIFSYAMLLTYSGLLTCAQTRRNFPRTAQRYAIRRSTWPDIQNSSTRRSTCCRIVFQASRRRGVFETFRSHHSPFSICIITTPNVEYKGIPRHRPLRPTRSSHTLDPNHCQPFTHHSNTTLAE